MPRTRCDEAQGRLFRAESVHPELPPILTPAARSADPETSHEAAEAMSASGRRSDQQRAVLGLIRRWPGCTAGELAARSIAVLEAQDLALPGERHYQEIPLPEQDDQRYYAIQRRVSELAPRYVRRGDKRRCRVRGTMATELWPL